jgi:hypothetical protein
MRICWSVLSYFNDILIGNEVEVQLSVIIIGESSGITGGEDSKNNDAIIIDSNGSILVACLENLG